jgi:hypothetical protein
MPIALQDVDVEKADAAVADALIVSGLVSCIRPICQPTDRSIVQPQELRNLSLTVPVTMYRLGNPPIPPGLAEPAPKQTLQLGPS